MFKNNSKNQILYDLGYPAVELPVLESVLAPPSSQSARAASPSRSSVAVSAANAASASVAAAAFRVSAYAVATLSRISR